MTSSSLYAHHIESVFSASEPAIPSTWRSHAEEDEPSSLEDFSQYSEVARRFLHPGHVPEAYPSSPHISSHSPRIRNLI